MSAESENLYEKFMSTACKLMPEQEKIKIQNKVANCYSQAKPTYLNCDLFKEFLRALINQLHKDPTNVFVHVLTLKDELKAHKTVKKDHGPCTSGAGKQANGENKGNSDQEDTFKSDANGYRIQKLEKIMKKLEKKIEKLSQAELSLSALNNPYSSYVIQEKYIKKFNKAWAIYCKLTSRKTKTGRPVERPFKYSGTRYEEINQRIEIFMKSKKNLFPDFCEIHGQIKEVNNESRLNLAPSTLHSIASDVFADVGKLLKQWREHDFYQNSMYILEPNMPDPAIANQELKHKLDSQNEAGKQKLEEVFHKYSSLQDLRKLEPEELEGDACESGGNASSSGEGNANVDDYSEYSGQEDEADKDGVSGRPPVAVMETADASQLSKDENSGATSESERNAPAIEGGNANVDDGSEYSEQEDGTDEDGVSRRPPVVVMETTDVSQLTEGESSGATSPELFVRDLDGNEKSSFYSKDIISSPANMNTSTAISHTTSPKPKIGEHHSGKPDEDKELDDLSEIYVDDADENESIAEKVMRDLCNGGFSSEVITRSPSRPINKVHLSNVVSSPTAAKRRQSTVQNADNPLSKKLKTDATNKAHLSSNEQIHSFSLDRCSPAPHSSVNGNFRRQIDLTHQPLVRVQNSTESNCKVENFLNETGTSSFSPNTFSQLMVSSVRPISSAKINRNHSSNKTPEAIHLPKKNIWKNATTPVSNEKQSHQDKPEVITLDD